MISKQRMLVYLMVGCFAVVGCVGWSVGERVKGAKRERMVVERMLGAARIKMARQEVNRAVRDAFAGADHRYVDRELETVELLKGEREGLRRLLEQEPGLPSKEVLGRLEKLEGNRVRFAEGKVRQEGCVSEVEEKLAKGVEVDIADVMGLLERIEGVGEGRPQMVVTEFGLRRKGEVFEMDMRFVKREFE